jgi:phenylpropionate dioxygenase-like ring-hydroxylating dioxygenase large terminal subunit
MTHSIATRDLWRADRNYPRNAWYAIATTGEVAEQPVGRRLLDTPVALYRTSTGKVAALHDLGAHRPYPLSLGHRDGDLLVSGYDGWAYDPDGTCVRIPTQAHVPYGTRVPSYPAREEGGLVWLWVGQPHLAARHPMHRLPWLAESACTSFGGTLDIAANYLLLYELLADISHVPALTPQLTPSVLRDALPPLEIEVTETTVRFDRRYPASHLGDWLSAATGLDIGGTYEQRESGMFAGPGLWTDLWQVQAAGQPRTLRFTQAVTPVGPSRSRLFWRVTRDFEAGSADVTKILQTGFSQYYQTLISVLATVQSTINSDGLGQQVHVTADAAALHVRKVIASMLEAELLTAEPSRRATQKEHQMRSPRLPRMSQPSA